MFISSVYKAVSALSPPPPRPPPLPLPPSCVSPTLPASLPQAVCLVSQSNWRWQGQREREREGGTEGGHITVSPGATQQQRKSERWRDKDKEGETHEGTHREFRKQVQAKKEGQKESCTQKSFNGWDASSWLMVTFRKNGLTVSFGTQAPLTLLPSLIIYEGIIRSSQ